ncbi:UNVERIFIED_CONTAM: hypothetical protein Slati_2471100 [Sesamum latifolium]|uniref:Uncharacterized protein n=1 Tax=Sesamum latifolium TaxID=2727402 RepID=A0AAW2WF53_9LAMI
MADSHSIGAVMLYACSSLGLLMICCYSVGLIRPRFRFSNEASRFLLTSRDSTLIPRRATSYYLGRPPLNGYIAIYLGLSGRASSPRYLGLPLLASRLSIADCKPILQKIDSRIKGWDGIMLSFAGRVQLIKSV